MGSVIVLGITALSLQWSYFLHKRSEREYVDAFRLSEELESKLDELTELKKQVELLRLKLGISLL